MSICNYILKKGKKNALTLMAMHITYIDFSPTDSCAPLYGALLVTPI